MPRPIWSGFIRLSLVSVPVQAYTAESKEGRDFAFHQLHKTCHSRIRYQKVCPLHGEVSNDEIVSAYEYEKGKYVLVDEEEKDRAEKKADKAIEIENFIPAAAVDPLLFEGSSYYLLPDGDAGRKSYSLLCQAMHDEERCALAEAVLWRRNRLVLLRPTGKLLTMSLLRFAGQMRKPTEFTDDVPATRVGAQEMRLAKRLIAESSVDDVDWSEYEDEVRKQLSRVIETKVSDDEVIETESDEEETPVINLMDALKKSVGRKGKRPAGGGRETKHTAVVRLPHAASHRRKPKPKAKKRKVS